jgi:hypothetical protein
MYRRVPSLIVRLSSRAQPPAGCRQCWTSTFARNQSGSVIDRWSSSSRKTSGMNACAAGDATGRRIGQSGQNCGGSIRTTIECGHFRRSPRRPPQPHENGTRCAPGP